MSKEILTSACNADNADNYVWSMCFYKIDHRAKGQPYKFYKVRFKNDQYLLTYAKSLMTCVSNYQISPLETVQEYDGENTKVSCDKIALDNELISTQWTSFVTGFGKAAEEKVSGRINGYVLFGISKTEENKTITFIKTANPITNLTNKKSVVFTANANDELEMFSDTVCRLFLNTDIVVVGQIMYTYNHNFEALFDLEKTMAKVKVVAIDKMVATDAIADPEAFKSYASQYTSNRTFITLKQERIERVTDKRKRKKVANMLKIDLDEAGDFIIDTKEKAAYFIKYLCFKIFQDAETNDILEASTISTVTI
jgi:hypothetical protein